MAVSIIFEKSFAPYLLSRLKPLKIKFSLNSFELKIYNNILTTPNNTDIAKSRRRIP